MMSQKMEEILKSSCDTSYEFCYQNKYAYIPKNTKENIVISKLQQKFRVNPLKLAIVSKDYDVENDVYRILLSEKFDVDDLVDIQLPTTSFEKTCVINMQDSDENKNDNNMQDSDENKNDNNMQESVKDHDNNMQESVKDHDNNMQESVKDHDNNMQDSVKDHDKNKNDNKRKYMVDYYKSEGYTEEDSKEFAEYYLEHQKFNRDEKKYMTHYYTSQGYSVKDAEFFTEHYSKNKKICVYENGFTFVFYSIIVVHQNKIQNYSKFVSSGTNEYPEVFMILNQIFADLKIEELSETFEEFCQDNKNCLLQIETVDIQGNKYDRTKEIFQMYYNNLS